MIFWRRVADIRQHGNTTDGAVKLQTSCCAAIFLHQRCHLHHVIAASCCSATPAIVKLSLKTESHVYHTLESRPSCSLCDRAMFPFFQAKIRNLEFKLTPNGLKSGTPSTAKIGPIIHHISVTVNYYSHIGSCIRAFHWYRNW